MMDDVERSLIGLARATGVEPKRVLADFRRGGALADLAQAVLGERRLRRPGPDADLEENWRRFVLVVLAGRSEKSSRFVQAAEMGQQGDDDPNDVLQGRYRQNYFRMKRERGWRDEDVPAGLGALFSAPPSR